MAGASLVSRPFPNGITAPDIRGAASPTDTKAQPASDMSFLLWTVFFGLVLPAVILGGLHAGRFRFVFVNGR